MGSDDPTLPLNETGNRRNDQRKVGTLLYNTDDPNISQDPATSTRSAKNQKQLFKKIASEDANGNLVTNYVRVYAINQSLGESVIKPASLIKTNPSPLNVESLLGGLTYHIIEDDK